MLTPLYGFREGDTIGLLVLAHEEDTIAQVAEKLQRSAQVRVAPLEHWDMRHGERLLNPEWTVKEAGLSALERIDLVTRQA